MSTQTATRLTTLGAEFHHAAKEAVEALRHIDEARKERILFLRKCSTDNGARLAALKEEVRTLPEQIAKWDAEAARLESQTAEDLLRQALEVAPKCDGDHKGPLCDDKQCWLRDPPEEEAEKPEPTLLDLRSVRLLEDHADADWVVADADLFDVGEKAETHHPSVEKGQRFQVERVAAPHGGPRVKIHIDDNQVFIAALQPAHVVPAPPAPTLLNLTELPPGTVCEALEDIPRWNGRTVAAGVHFTLRDQSIVEGDEFPMVVTTNGENSYCIPYVVPARVVKEGGEQ